MNGLSLARDTYAATRVVNNGGRAAFLLWSPTPSRHTTPRSPLVPLMLDAGRSLPPLTRRRAMVHSTVLTATPPPSCPGADVPVLTGCSCSCHVGDFGCDLLPGATRLWRRCDGTVVS